MPQTHSGQVALKGNVTHSASSGHQPANGPNEPSGYTVITNRPFSALNEDGWYDGSYSPGTMSIVSDATAPVSPPYVGQMYFPSGWSSGNAPGYSYYGLSGYSHLYISFWVKLSTTWQPQSAYINKIGYVWINSEPSVVIMYYGGSFPLSPIIGLQDIPTGSVQLSQNVNTATLANDGNWHHWEIVLIGNTPGTANGTCNWWFDGTQVGGYTNIEYVASGYSNDWNYMYWEPVWGGAGGASTQAFDMYMDNWYASGSP